MRQPVIGMVRKIQAIKGMHDALPTETPHWQVLESTIQSVLEGYGYAEIRLPILERTELFQRAIGDGTDIVNKEMYTFSDRHAEHLTLRPEGTAGCVRAVLEHGLLAKGVLRSWYRGPMFRYERPQQGRFRQFHQAGAEVFGIATADIDAELILICKRLWQALGIADVRLELNTLGTAACRQHYRHTLVEYFRSHHQRLDADSQHRLEVNPLRLLDSKDPALQPIIRTAPVLTDYLDAESQQHFETLQALLQAAGVTVTLNPHLVRGLDYYNHTVFEWVTDQLGAQGTICAGGRYDGLVEQIGGKPTPATGFAMGLERLLALMPTDTRQSRPVVDIYLVAVGAAARQCGLQLAEQLRNQYQQRCIIVHCGDGSFKSQMRQADKSGARLALVLGEQEVADNTIGIKSLRTGQAQFTLAQSNLPEQLGEYL